MIWLALAFLLPAILFAGFMAKPDLDKTTQPLRLAPPETLNP